MNLLLFLALLVQDDVGRLIEQLGSDDIETRDAAQRKLEAMGVRAKPPLSKALAGATGEQAARIKATLARLPRLEVVVRTTKGKHKVGETLGLEVRIRNVWDETLVVVGSLDGSDTVMRYPRLTLEIRNEKGEIMRSDPVLGCGNINQPRAKDFVELTPGKEFDPYMRVDDYGFFGSRMLDWKPKASGKYSIAFTYDTTAEDFKQWDSELNLRKPDGETMQLFQRVYRTKIVSKPLVVTVE